MPFREPSPVMGEGSPFLCTPGRVRSQFGIEKRGGVA